MKWSKMMIQTLREDPGDAEIDSHKLLVRAALGAGRRLVGLGFFLLTLGLVMGAAWGNRARSRR